MEFEPKTIEIPGHGEVTVLKTGGIEIHRLGERIFVGDVAGTSARKYAHAILELIGDPVPSKGDDTYIAVVKAEYGYFLGGRIVGAISGPMYADTAIESLQEDAPGDEFHIFRRVATVGPIPQPERKVTRYE